MRLAFDARHIESDERGVRARGGVGRYVLELLKELPRVVPELDLLLIVRRSNTRPIFAEPACKLVEAPFFDEPNSWLTEYLLAPTISLKDREVFHSPFQILPRGLPCPSVVTVHDTMWLTNPELCSSFTPERKYLGALYGSRLRRCLKHADHVVTISRASAQDILPFRASGVTVAPHGIVDSDWSLPSERRIQILQRLIPSGSQYVLMVGQGSPYKNHRVGVEAFMHAFSERPGLRLVLVRRFHRRDTELDALLSQAAVQEKLILLQQVSDEELKALYGGASVFLFPSLKEGFGMPLLEAMASGTPVVTSTAAACAEIAGDAALAADPTDARALARALVRLVDDGVLRAVLTTRGSERVKRYAWSLTSELTTDAYASLQQGQRQRAV